MRPITPDDAQGAHDVTMAGFGTYDAFAPPGWQPPADMGAEGATERLAREGAYGVVAVDNDEVVGFAAYEPARQEGDEGFSGPLIPGLAHVWAVFLAESHWGQGVASRLLAVLTDHIRTAGSPKRACTSPPARRGGGPSTPARAGARLVSRSSSRSSDSSSSRCVARSSPSCPPECAEEAGCRGSP